MPSETDPTRRAVLWFLVLTFATTWAVWATLWLPGVAAGPLLPTLVLAATMWLPGLSALLVIRVVLGQSTRSTAIGRLGPLRYYVWAWALPIAGTLAAMLLTVLLGIARFDPEFTWLRSQIEAAGAALPAPLWTIVLIQILAGLTVGAAFNCLFTLGEEIGWRGFLLPKLIHAGMGQWPALALSGLVWGIWHAPVILRGHNYPDHPQLGVVLMTVFCCLTGVVFGWLRLASGSVWPPTLAHATLNAVAGMPLVLLTPLDTAFGGMLTSVVGWIPILLLIGWLAWRGRLPVGTREA